MSNKIFANIATDRFKKLVGYLSDLENLERQKMSSSGKEYLDRIWKLLGLPTYDEHINMINKQNEEEE